MILSTHFYRKSKSPNILRSGTETVIMCLGRKNFITRPNVMHMYVSIQYMDCNIGLSFLLTAQNFEVSGVRLRGQQYEMEVKAIDCRIRAFKLKTIELSVIMFLVILTIPSFRSLSLIWILIFYFIRVNVMVFCCCKIYSHQLWMGLTHRYKCFLWW